MTAFNVVRFRVKPGREQEFLDAHQHILKEWPGLRRVSILTYHSISEEPGPTSIPPAVYRGHLEALEAGGHEVVIADLVLHGTRSIAAFAADVGAAELIGIGATSMSWPTAADVIRRSEPCGPTCRSCAAAFTRRCSIATC